MNLKIAASFLDIKQPIVEEVTKLSNLDIDYLHLDVMDGIFVENKTFTYEEFDNIAKDILVGMNKTNCEYRIIPDRKDAIEYALRNAQNGDIVLLAGKGHEKYEIDSNGKREFDEKRIVAELVRKYYSN